jgi:predicted phosphodiesterase
VVSYRKIIKRLICRNRRLKNAACILIFLAALYPANSIQASWKFIAVGDSQGSDNGVNTNILSELASEIIDEGVDCVLFCGDLVWCRREEQLESELNNWRSIMEPVYDANIPVYPCRGNHENRGSSAVWQSFFSDLPDNGPIGEEYMTYSVTHKNALFVALDEYVNPHRINQAWLDTQISSNSEPIIFVFGHEPAFRMHHEDCLDDYPADRDRFWYSIKRAGGRTYFSGHDHFFDHAHVDDGDGDPNNDVHQFTIGTAGAPFYTFSPPYDGNNSYFTVEQVYHAKAYGYVLVEVNDLDISLIWMQRNTNNPEDIGTYEPNAIWNFSAKPLILLSPNGGENIFAGSVFNIKWRTCGDTTFEKALLEFSTDNGRNWSLIDAVNNTGFYEWSVPMVDSNECLLRVSDLNDQALSDTSYKVFRIFNPCDFEPDGDIDFDDFAVLAESWKSTLDQPDYNPECDISDPNDGIIDYRDMFVFVSCWLAGKQ